MIDLTKLTLEEIISLKSQLDSIFTGQINKPKRTRVCTPGVKQGRPLKFMDAALKWDWSLPDTEIARQYKMNVAVIYKYRKRLNQPPATADHNKLPDVVIPPMATDPKWETLDWSKHDSLLAKDVGLTRERVRQMRATLGIPKMLYRDRKFNLFKKTFEGRAELGFDEAYDRLEISIQTFNSYCVRCGIKRIKSPRTDGVHPWSKMNFNLPNKVLSEIWNMKTNVCAGHRCNNHEIKHKWNNSSTHPDFLAAIELEKKKQIQHMAEINLTKTVDNESALSLQSPHEHENTNSASQSD